MIPNTPANTPTTTTVSVSSAVALPKKNLVAGRRLGRFSLSRQLMGDPLVSLLLGEMDIWQSTPRFDKDDHIEFLASHSEFDEVAVGDFIPRYSFTWESGERKPAQKTEY